MFRLRLGGLERLEALDELAPERLVRRVPVKAREATHLEDGVAEVPEQRQRAAVGHQGRHEIRVGLVQLNDRKAGPVCLHTSESSRSPCPVFSKTTRPHEINTNTLITM